MTENEAKFLEKLDELANDTEVDMYSVANLNFFFEESANTIRKLIEEIQQYRAIGTVEGYEKAIQSSMEYYNLMKEYKAKVDELEAIGTIEEFKALKEKSVAKKVAYQGEHEKCPNCGSFHVFGKHCTECGQAVDYD